MTERLVRRPDLLSGAGLAAVVGVQILSGHPESSFHALVATGAFLVLRLVQARRAGAPESPGRCAPRWRSGRRASAGCCWPR